MSDVDFSEAAENVRAAARTLRAFMQFRNDVGALMLNLIERGDPTGLVLLELVRDMDARMSELYVAQEQA